MSKSQGTGIVLLVVPQHLGANNAVKPTAYGGGLLLTLDVTVPQRHLRAVFQWKFIMQVMPIAKNGTCPTGYSAQGNMCVPNANAKPAIPKNGTCPTGWSAQGNYCVANSNNPKTVIPKNGTCPTGYSAQGNYCVSNK